jgi:two-component system OmpR family sensor kinase
MSTDPGASGPGRGRPVRWLGRRTLRARLIAGLLALLAVACAAVGIVTFVSLHGYLLGQLDQQLVQASHRYQACLGHPPPADDDSHPGPPRPDSPFDCAQQQQAQTFSAQIRHGVLIDNYVSYGTCTLSHADKAVLTSGPAGGQPFTRDLSSLGDYRLLAVSGPPGSGVTYLNGLPMTQVNSTLRQVAIVEIAVFAAALVLTGVLGTGFVRLSLRPLRRVAATATSVTELPLASAASESRLRRFAADASHELRTPLAAIRGYAELARRHPGPVPGDIAHALARVESESARMSVLVDELLLLAQLDAGRPLAKEPVDLTRLAIDTTSDARAASPGHHWTLELPDEPVLVEGDEHRLHQVLANMMSNAAQHTPEGTTVTVAVAAENPQAVRVSVTDTGPGIPGDLQPALFERFVRGDSARPNGGGSTGLGLAIVQAVTTAHGGTVSVASRPGHTSFVITLPRLASAAVGA